MFLDIQMPAISGFELLSMIDDAELPEVVFVTAHDEHAVRAFEERALDYLLKPVAPRAAREDRRAAAPRPPARRPPRRAIRAEPSAASRASPGAPSSSSTSRRWSSCARARPGCTSSPRSVEVFTELTLKVLEERAGLVRCHKQFLVNIDQVDEISLDEGLAAIRTRSGKDVPVSRRHLAGLRQLLEI